MSDPVAEETGFEQPPPAPIRWQSWPARNSALRTSLVVIGLLATALVIYGLCGQMYLAVLALAALVVALRRFFVPVVFELGEEGVHQWLFGRQRRIAWQAIGGYEVCSAGVLLWPEKDPSALAPFHGLYVPWTSHRDEVLAHVRHRLGRPDGA